MKRILIGGCSFSQNMGFNNNLWISWSDFLKRDYGKQHEIINRGQSSFGQSRIVESVLEELIRYNFEVDYVFIQWSAVGRAYSINERDFFERFVTQWEVPFSPHQHEYIVSGNKTGWVTNVKNEIEHSFYRASLTQIILMKNLLENKRIPYKMFWGWEQITPSIESEVSDLLNQIYDENFWRVGNHGGMSEYIIDGIGEKDGIIENDFHPTTKGQEYFYNTVIKSIIDEKESYNNSQRIL